MRSLFLIYFISVIILVNAQDFEYLHNISIEQAEDQLDFSQFENHDPISITGNGGFSSYNLTGTGTSQDPYVLENYQFQSSDPQDALFSIRATTQHLIVRNNYFNGDNIHTNAIHLITSSNIIFENNTIENFLYNGIFIEGTSFDVEISQNLISKNKNFGIEIDGSIESIEVTNNKITIFVHGYFIIRNLN